MRLLHKDYQFMFELSEDSKGLLVIEQPKIFREMIKELVCEEEIEDEKFILSENNQPLKLKEKMCCIINPFTLSLNEKKILNRLHEYLKKEIGVSELLLENNKIYAELEQYALKILQVADWELVYSEKTEVSNLLKFLDIRFSENQTELIEKIVDYIKCVNELLGIKCFIFVHLLGYLNEYEIKKLYEFAEYQKVNILLMESVEPSNVKEFSPVTIIDKDGCEISIGMR